MRLQDLPHPAVSGILRSLSPHKTCFYLGASCKNIYSVFEDGPKDDCKRAALVRLLRLHRQPVVDCHGNFRMSLAPIRTERLSRWLANGYITFADFWEAQPRISEDVRTLTIVVRDKFPRGHVASGAEVAQLKTVMKNVAQVISPGELIAVHHPGWGLSHELYVS